jgi:hypothetical protein
MTILNALTGWTGALLVLFAFYVALVKDWKVESGRYLLISCIASSLLCANAALNAAWPFLVINASMLLVAAYKMAREGWPAWK